jgi:hypothetical protein
MVASLFLPVAGIYSGKQIIQLNGAMGEIASGYKTSAGFNRTQQIGLRMMGLLLYFTLTYQPVRLKVYRKGFSGGIGQAV